MENNGTEKTEKLRNMCNTIALEQPDAMGIAYIELDCGCIYLSGVSAKGDPVGQMHTISAQPAGEDKKPPICLKCYRSKTLEMQRVVKMDLMWPGEASERPAKALRLYIGQKVFGPDYTDTSG